MGPQRIIESPSPRVDPTYLRPWRACPTSTVHAFIPGGGGGGAVTTHCGKYVPRRSKKKNGGGGSETSSSVKIGSPELMLATLELTLLERWGSLFVGISAGGALRGVSGTRYCEKCACMHCP